MKRYKVIRIIGVVLLVLGAVLIILQIMEGGKSFIGSIAGGATPIIMGALLLGISFRVENKEQASSNPSDVPK